MKCDCGRQCGESWKYSRNKLFNNVCSRYCQIRKNRGEKHDPSRTYTTQCSVCDNTFNLKYSYNHANQIFCSHACVSRLSKINRRARKNHFLLMAIYLHPDGLTAQDLFDYSERNVFRIKNAAGVAGILSQWVRKGIVSRTKVENGLSIYRWNSDLPPGQAMLRR